MKDKKKYTMSSLCRSQKKWGSYLVDENLSLGKTYGINTEWNWKQYHKKALTMLHLVTHN